ncbi:hypothetical protein Tco_1506828 [Tanacetum coccineum]
MILGMNHSGVLFCSSIIPDTSLGGINYYELRIGSHNTWLKFESCDFTQESKKAFRTTYKDLMKKDIEGLEALDFADFAWNRLFRIQKPVIHEYVLEFLSTIHFKDHVVELDVVDMVVFQLGGAKRSMTMREFSLPLGLNTAEE